MKEWFEGDGVYEDPPPLILPIGLWIIIVVGSIGLLAGLS